MDDKKQKLQSDERNDSPNNNLGTGMTISDLNDDCLRCILTYLPFKDKVILQRVSKRWQLLMPWKAWNGPKMLQIVHNGIILGNEGWMPYSLPSLKKVLDLCGNFIKDVVISRIGDEMKEILKLLKKLCPNLKSLAVHGYQLTESFMQFLSQNFDPLISISIGKCAKGCENEIYKLFAELKNLLSIKFQYSNMKETCLTGLALRSIEEFYIVSSEDLTLTNLSKAFQRMCNLRVLELCSNFHLIENIIKLLKDLPNRSELENWVSKLDMYIAGMKNLVQMKNLCYLTNLQELCLNGPQVVCDEALTVIGNTCKKLKIVDITCSHKLTDAGWQNFAKLSSIEELRIGELRAITDKWLLHLKASSLKSLECFEIDLTNESLKFFLKAAKSLELLDVAECPNVDYNMLIMDASAHIESRPKHERLELRIDMKKINHKVENISSRLSVKETTYYSLLPVELEVD